MHLKFVKDDIAYFTASMYKVTKVEEDVLTITRASDHTSYKVSRNALQANSVLYNGGDRPLRIDDVIIYPISSVIQILNPFENGQYKIRRYNNLSTSVIELVHPTVLDNYTLSNAHGKHKSRKHKLRKHKLRKHKSRKHKSRKHIKPIL